jgi:hypothetical protein
MQHLVSEVAVLLKKFLKPRYIVGCRLIAHYSSQSSIKG